jgi:phage terminase small subunit
MKLNERQKAFCEYYAASFNATESAKKAGYSQKTAYSIGQENLKKPEIQKYLAELTEKMKSSRIATLEEVYEYLSETMRDGAEERKERTKAAQLLMTSLERKAPQDDGNDREKLDELCAAISDIARGGDNG